MNQKGFTLAELSVCCIIISILGTIACPCWGAIKKSLTLRTEISMLCSNLQKAKIEAIKHNNYIVFQLIPGGYRIFVDDGKGTGKRGDWVRQATEEELVYHQFKDGIKMSGTTFTANRTRFNGRVGMKAGSVILANTDGSQTKLVINIVGRLRVEKL